MKGNILIHSALLTSIIYTANYQDLHRQWSKRNYQHAPGYARTNTICWVLQFLLENNSTKGILLETHRGFELSKVIEEEKREKEKKNVRLRADELLLCAFLCVLLRGISALRYTPRYCREANSSTAAKTPKSTKNRTAHSQKTKRKRQRRPQSHFQLSDRLNLLL